MRRRQALAVLAGAVRPAAGAQNGIATAVLVDVASRKPLAVRGGAGAGSVLRPPGSTLKPLVLAALMKRGRLSAGDTFACPGVLTLGGRNLNCSHPRLNTALRVETALAYSCNCFVAHFAERFEPGELARELEACGLASPSGLVADEAAGRIAPARTRDAVGLQALGEEGAAVTVAELAMAYRRLALSADAAIVAGMEGAVQYGTAQYARVEGLSVAGKTGSLRLDSGELAAWFAGFAPSRAPQVAIAVRTQGRSGGADAAPIAARMLEAWRAGRL